jgi:hypothetical protein
MALSRTHGQTGRLVWTDGVRQRIQLDEDLLGGERGSVFVDDTMAWVTTARDSQGSGSEFWRIEGNRPLLADQGGSNRRALGCFCTRPAAG